MFSSGGRTSACSRKPDADAFAHLERTLAHLLRSFLARMNVLHPDGAPAQHAPLDNPPRPVAGLIASETGLVMLSRTMM